MEIYYVEEKDNDDDDDDVDKVKYNLLLSKQMRIISLMLCLYNYV